MKTLLGLFAIAALVSAPVARAEGEAAEAATHQQAEETHKHKHGKKCGHKAEKHGDHTDYHHEEDGKVHHHKKHGKHYDECEGPEAEAGEAAKKAE